MSSLDLYAGPVARKWIENHGLDQDQVKVMVAASGGPKWFVLYGLDRYLFGEFFANRTQPLELLGSSAGAWRLACLAQADPVAAIERLATHYSQQCYPDRVTLHTISSEARRMLDLVLAETGAMEIVTNPVFRLHVVAARARGIISSENRHLLSLGLFLCGLSNAAGRRNLRWHFERTIFHNAVAGGSAFSLMDMPTHYVPLQEHNLRAALMASGSIPVIMEGVTDIADAPPGTYRDGGITDYHFDMPFHQGDGLVLYPHFYPTVTAGWFDKLLPWRQVNPVNFDNVLLLTPSAEFVSRLPFAKIPDRKDFERLDDATRLAYWKQVLDESERLAEDFADLLISDQLPGKIKPLLERSKHA
jgi:hypothetical protein